MSLLSLSACIQSVTSRSSPQSPPPITFPALTVEIFAESFEVKNESLYDDEINSAAPLLALYGS